MDRMTLHPLEFVPPRGAGLIERVVELHLDIIKTRQAPKIQRAVARLQGAEDQRLRHHMNGAEDRESTSCDHDRLGRFL